MHLEFANIPEFEPQKLELAEEPAFFASKPDFKKLRALWQEFGHFKNILVIGHGGSVTSFMGMYHTLPTDKHVKVLSTIDPDYIQRLKKKFLPAETLVIAISKSGETVTQIEALMQFINYPLLVITRPGTVLEEIAKKAKAKIIPHPKVGGRFTAFTEVALVPAAICGMDIQPMYQAGMEFYKKYRQDNLAMKAAQAMYVLENQGVVDVFEPFYSHELFAFRNLIIQLCHETFCKDGKGQTYFAHEAPESQHHTNQRFFGGRKNIAGFFINLEHYKHDLFTGISLGMQSIHIKDGSLAELNKMPLSYSMHAEYKGTWEDAKIHAIPIVGLSISQVSPAEIGEFIAFWQLFAVYSAMLRGVDPFNQPQVENSKAISWNKRKQFRNP